MEDIKTVIDKHWITLRDTMTREEKKRMTIRKQEVERLGLEYAAKIAVIGMSINEEEGNEGQT